MKKILIAMDNIKLIDRIKKTGKYFVDNTNFKTQDEVLEYLSENSPDVIITKDTLKGNKTKEIYLKQLSILSGNSKIILFAKELTDNYMAFLKNNNILNIIEDENENLYFLELLDLIENIHPKIMYKNSDSEFQDYAITTDDINLQKLVAVYGTSGAGKSYFSSVLGNISSKKIKSNTLLIDMDMSSSAMDIYNNVDKNNDSLLKVMEDIDKETFSSVSFKDSISNSKKNSRLYFLVNNSSFLDIQNKFSPMYYEKIYNSAKDKYDATIVDLPDSPFLDVVPFTLAAADVIFFVINPNFISIRQAIKKLELMTKVWKIPATKIQIVVNNKKKSSLDISQIQMLLKFYNIVSEIESSDLVEKAINGMGEIVLDNIKNMDKILYVLSGNDKYLNNKDTKKGFNKKITEMFGVVNSVN